MQGLEEELEKAKTEAAKVKGLEEQLEKLNRSSVLDKQKAIDKLTSELQDKYKGEIDTLRSSHETELLNLRSVHQEEVSKLNSAHDKEIAGHSGLKLRDEIREIKAGFERDKENAVNQAVAAATAWIRKEIVELEQQLKSTLIELTAVKAELELTTKRLKQFEY